MGKFKIDKSNFTPEQLAQWEELLEIGKSAEVDPAAAKKEMEGEEPAAPAVPPKKTKKAEVDDVEDTKKSAPAEPAAETKLPDFVMDAVKKSNEFIEKAEKQEQVEVAKKYAALVEDTNALAEQLYGLKKSDPKMYDTCISMMDNQMNMIEKSGLFGEVGTVGKSASAAGGYEAQADAKAQEIMKADPTIDYDTAIAKAYEDPAIMAACDAEYYGHR